MNRWHAVACDHVVAERSLDEFALATSAHTDLAGMPHAAPLARIFIREHLRGQLPVGRLQLVELLTTELVTNAVLHAKSSIHLGVTRGEHNVLVTVQDYSLQTPVETPQHLDGDPVVDTGRGLMVLAALADDFGWSLLPDGSGKVMWFTLAIHHSLPQQARRVGT
jgi:anti-sigma regulatory factor (Ser/Thr protein kinase)